MKKKRLLALCMSALLLAWPLGEVHAEQPHNQGSSSGMNDVTSEMMPGGYIESDLDQNTPVYEPQIAMYSVIPSSYQTNPTELETRYPTTRDQNPYGTCWVFSSLGLAEYDLINDETADKSIDLSELQLAYFTYNSVTDPLGGTSGDEATYYNENATESYLNYGGNYEMASRRLGQWISPDTEADVPYSNAQNVLENGLDTSYAYKAGMPHLENAYLINIKENQDDVKQQIMEHGAAGVMYYHDDNAMGWNDALARYTYYDTNKSGGGHAVMIVGWDDNFSKDNFTGANKPSSNGAWLIRNSWGMYCNYFWMSYETTSLSDTAWIFDFNANDGFDNNYQYDGGASVWHSNQYTTMANVFTTQKKEGISAELLKAVSVSMTSAANVNYTIDIYTDMTKPNDPTSGVHQTDATTQGQTAYAGVYTIELENAVKLKPGSTYAVVVSVDKCALDYEQGSSLCSADDSSKYVWYAPVSLGNGKTLYAYNQGKNFAAYTWGNLCVKAFTSNVKEEIESYTVSFDANGGSVKSTSKTVFQGDTYGSMPIPERTGYTFAGWYTAAEGGEQVTDSTQVNLSENQTLYAHWTLNKYTITFDANGGQVDQTGKVVSYSETYGMLPTPTRIGYSFAGWYTNATGGYQVNADSQVSFANDQTLYAHWTKEEITPIPEYGIGIYTVNGEDVYYVDGTRQYTTDLVQVGDIWYRLVNGVVQKKATVAPKKDGWWYINENGILDQSYTGFASNENGEWYVVSGKVNFDVNNVLPDETGALGANGTWYYVKKNKVTYTNTIANNRNGWWLIRNGKVDFSGNTVANNENGWWLIRNGKVDFNANTVANNENGWWLIRNGKVDFNAYTVANNQNGWWRIEGGKVNFKYNGLANNQNGWWYIRNGKVDFSHNGYVWLNGFRYRIVNGKVK